MHIIFMRGCKLKKLNAFIIVLSSLLLLLPVLSSACKTAQPTAPTQPATSAPTTPTASVQEPIELSLAGSSPLTSPTAESIDRWINKVSKESNGLLKIRHFPGSTLLPTPDIHPGVMAGAADLGSSLPYKPQPRLDAALAMAGLITGQNHESSLKIFEDLWSRFPDVWEDQWKDVKLIYLTVITPSILSTVNKPVRTPEDLKGLEIRTPDAFTSGLYKNLGATPVVIPTGDLAIALQKGTVDGIAFSTAGLVDFSLGELMKIATYFKII
jgi:TRAP-type C4-dicarboxylate transport system substrate-binding protein